MIIFHKSQGYWDFVFYYRNLGGFSGDEDEGFNLDELDSGDSDPLDAVTGEEDEVSADIWDLE